MIPAVAFGSLLLAGVACNEKRDEVRQIAAERLESAAKKLSGETPTPGTTGKAESAPRSVPADTKPYRRPFSTVGMNSNLTPSASRNTFPGRFGSTQSRGWVKCLGLIRHFGRLPRHHLPGAVPLGVYINEPGFEFVIADVELGVAGDHRGITELTDFNIFPFHGSVVGAA